MKQIDMGHIRKTLWLGGFWWCCFACGSGIPVQVRIDDFTVTLDISQQTTKLETSLVSQGLIKTNDGLPEQWSQSLPDVNLTLDISTSPQSINLSISDPKNTHSISSLKPYLGAIGRVELNDLTLRIEQNTSNIDLPALSLQAATNLDVNSNDNKSWYTIGTFPTVPLGLVADLPLSFAPGGKSFIDANLSDEPRQFSIRTVGLLNYDTAQTPQLPRGQLNMRLIMTVTVFIDPQNL